MSQIAVVLRVLSPLVLAHPLVRTLRALAVSLLRVAASFGAGAAIYGLVLFLAVESYAPAWPLAAIVYGVALALASSFGICVATLVANGRQRHGVMLVSSALAALLPVVLYIDNVAGGNPRPLFVCYVMGGVVGSLGAVKLLTRLGNRDFGHLILRHGRLAG